MAETPPLIVVNIQLNPGDHPEDRDGLARALCAECGQLPDVESAALATRPASDDARGEVIEIGQIAVAVAPVMLDYLLQWLGQWQQREPQARQAIHLDLSEDRLRAELPADVDPARLAALVRALRGEG